MIQKKKEINKNWLYSIMILALFLFGLITGFRSNMLKADATAFSNSSVTYNENQVLTSTYSNGFSTTTRYISIYKSSTAYSIHGTETAFSQYSNIMYSNCSLNNNILTCTDSFNISAGTTGNATGTNGTYAFTINSDTITFNGNTYTIVQTGYTEQEYLAYGQQQYSAGYNAGIAYVQAHPAEYSLYTSAQYSANYTAGQNSVINSPNTYNLYTQAQYEANYTSGYNAGIAYVQANPSQYNLYTASQYTDYGTSQYNAGIAYVQANPSQYNLYTASQYNSYGSSQFTAGESSVINNPNNYNLYTSQQYADNYTAGQNSVINDPNTYGLYTLAQYNAHAQEQYNAGYNAGLIDNTESYNAGIQYVLDNPSEYNLYTENQYNAYGTAQYQSGIDHVLDNLSDYNLYNQVQLETAEQNSYSEGYQEGIDSYQSNNVVIPEFTINKNDMYYACESNNPQSPVDYYQRCHPSTPNSSTTIAVLKPSDYMPYTNRSTVLYNSDLSNDFYGYNIDLFQYYINVGQSISSQGTIAIPESVTDVYIKFCNGESSYYVSTLNNQYSYCKSIATNVPNESNNGEYWGITDVYNNMGIKVSEITNIENGYRLINLNDYLVSYDNSYYYIEIILNNNSSTIQTQYNNLTIQYVTGTLDSTAYNLGYQNGFSQGNKVGLVTGRQENYNNGYNAGYQQARRVGENSIRGIAETILTSPVNMFKTIFNVEFLGVNLAGFILSIFTMIIVIWLIKKLW